MLDMTDCSFSLNGVHDYCILNNEIWELKNKLYIDRNDKQVIKYFFTITHRGKYSTVFEGHFDQLVDQINKICDFGR